MATPTQPLAPLDSMAVYAANYNANSLENYDQNTLPAWKAANKIWVDRGVQNQLLGVPNPTPAPPIPTWSVCSVQGTNFIYSNQSDPSLQLATIPPPVPQPAGTDVGTVLRSQPTAPTSTDMLLVQIVAKLSAIETKLGI